MAVLIGTDKKNTIKVTKYSDIQFEKVAHEALFPGHLIQFRSTDGEIQKHSTSSSQDVLPIMFAIEDELQGRGINTTYAEDDIVQCWIPGRGDIVYAILKDGQDIDIGDALESNGDGTLKKYTADAWETNTAGTVYPNQIVGVAMEALDLSDSSLAEGQGDLGLDKRILIMVI